MRSKEYLKDMGKGKWMIGAFALICTLSIGSLSFSALPILQRTVAEQGMARGVMVRCMAEIKAQATISQWNRGTLLRMRGFVPEPGDIPAASVEALILSLCDNLERHMPDAPEGHRWIMLSCLFLAFVAWEPMHPREVVHHRNTVIMGRQHWFCPVREDSAERLCRFCVCKTESR